MANLMQLYEMIELAQTANRLLNCGPHVVKQYRATSGETFFGMECPVSQAVWQLSIIIAEQIVWPASLASPGIEWDANSPWRE